MMHPNPAIALAIPAWRAAALIGETLRSALAQTGVDVQVFVSIDEADAATAERCAAISDSRVTVHMQEQRLGWVGNSNAALQDALQSDADYVALLPHDDLLLPDYCARLIDTIEANPGTAIAFTDIQNFGTNMNVMARDDVLGTRLERFEALVRGPMKAIPYRGVMPRDVAAKALPLPSNRFEDYAADSVWMLRQAAWGEMRRIPAPLYRKRYHDRNTHGAWADWDRAKRFGAYLQYCRDCQREVGAFTFSDQEQGRLRAAFAFQVQRTRKLFGDLCEDEEERVGAMIGALARAPAQALG